jgi:hypothetical protein
MKWYIMHMTEVMCSDVQLLVVKCPRQKEYECIYQFNVISIFCGSTVQQQQLTHPHAGHLSNIFSYLNNEYQFLPSPGPELPITSNHIATA